MAISTETSSRILSITAFSLICSLILLMPSGCGKKQDSAAIPCSDETCGMPDVTVVEVDGTKLSSSELDEKLNKILARSAGGMPPEFAAQQKAMMRGNMIESFIAETLLTKEADRLQVTVGDEEVTEMITTIKNQISESMPGMEDPLAVIGMTEEELKLNVMRELKIRKLIEPKMAETADASDEDIDTFYHSHPEYFTNPETVDAKHILFMINKDDPEDVKAEKKALADKCREDLVAGADFAELARKHSDCPSKESGGNLGSFGRGQMVPAFEDAAFSQKIDEIGPVVETDYGHHIIQVLQHEKSGSKPLEEVKPMIADFLNKNRQQEIVMEYVNELKSKADIKYHENPTTGLLQNPVLE